MARIDEFLAKILSSRYGRDVRNAIHDSIEEINNVNEANIATVQGIADTAQGYANNASDSADTAEQAVTDAQAQVTLANTARTGAETAEDGAEHFYQETLAIAQSLGSALIPKGTVEFANLPSVSSSAVKDGFMWNISDPFTTTSDFVEGAGLSIPMGANVYKVTINNVPKWDILAGSSAQVFTGTEAQIAQAIQQGLLGEGVMINSLDDGEDELLTTSMISHDGDSLENKLDEIDDNLDKFDKKSSVVTPTSSGKDSLLRYILDVVDPMNLSTYSFPASIFTDLPNTTSTFVVTVSRDANAFNVVAYEALSASKYYVRAMGAGGSSRTWVQSSWDRLALESEVDKKEPSITSKLNGWVGRAINVPISLGSTLDETGGLLIRVNFQNGGNDNVYIPKAVLKYATSNMQFAFANSYLQNSAYYGLALVTFKQSDGSLVLEHYEKGASIGTVTLDVYIYD